MSVWGLCFLSKFSCCLYYLSSRQRRLLRPSSNQVVQRRHASLNRWVAHVFDYELHCGGMLTRYYTDHLKITSNESGYEELIYKESGFKIVLVYMMPVAGPHISLIGYAGNLLLHVEKSVLS